MPDPVRIHQGSPVFDGQRNPIPNSFQKISDLSSAVGLTPPATAVLAIIVCEDQNVRWRDDSVDPTASDDGGMLMLVGDVFLYTGVLSKIKFVEVTAGASIGVSYYQ